MNVAIEWDDKWCTNNLCKFLTEPEVVLAWTQCIDLIDVNMSSGTDKLIPAN